MNSVLGNTGKSNGSENKNISNRNEVKFASSSTSRRHFYLQARCGVSTGILSLTRGDDKGEPFTRKERGAQGMSR